MKRIATLLASLAALLWAPLAHAALGTPTDLGGAYGAASATTMPITTLNPAPAGNLVVMMLYGRASPSYTSTTDSASNCGANYTTATNVIVGSTRVVTAYCQSVANTLSAAGTITPTTSGLSSNGTSSAFTVSGVAVSGAIDVIVTPASGTGTTFSISTGTLAQANEVLFACTTLQSAASGDTWTEDSANGWTSFGTVAGSSTNRFTHCAYKVVSSTASVTYAPSFTSRSYIYQLVTFKAAASASGGGGLTLLGVGN